MRTELIAFVRGPLGCGCPDEVFSDLRIEHRPEIFAGLPVESVLEIGGRLLVVVCAPATWQEFDDALEQILEAGTRARDATSFNRLRVVAATPDPTAAQPDLTFHFSRLSNTDERTFLHVLEPTQVPKVLLSHERE